ncbi:hypothetical protein DTO063F5_5974 [Paecilomyces variotii]|nr:hypothetical protein DTO063F5_5974 [Paecilomyces variotii]
MATTKSPKGNNRIEYHHWDHSFRWTELHRSSEELRPLTVSWDKLADECIDIINGMPSGPSDTSKNPCKRDIYALLSANVDKNAKLKEFWTEINTVPEWVDWEQIKRGQDVFYRYAIPIIIALAFQSLLGGMGAPRVVETLSRTGGFSASVVRRRLLETVQHTLDVTGSVNAMKPGGEGHVSSVRVRLLHSVVRLRILNLAIQQPDYYDKEKYGVPINDLDCIATINIFSSNVVWMGLPRQGVYLSQQEIEDYIALWRLVAYYMGTPTEAWENTEKAKAMMESLLVSEIDPSETGKILAKNIILGLENTPPLYVSKELLEAITRLLNGKDLSDELDIPRSSLYYRIIIYGYCFGVIIFSYMKPKSGFLDRKVIEWYRKYLRDIMIYRKDGLGGETLFDFKYLPTLTRTTRLGKRRTNLKWHGMKIMGLFGPFITLGLILFLGIGWYSISIALSAISS